MFIRVFYGQANPMKPGAPRTPLKRISFQTPLVLEARRQRLSFGLMSRRNANVVGESAANVARPVHEDEEKLCPLVAYALQDVVHLGLQVRRGVLVEEMPIPPVRPDAGGRDKLYGVEVGQGNITLVLIVKA